MVSILNADDRTIFRLAIPALGALAADPLVSVVDTAFVGRLGGPSLAALGVGVAVLAFAFFLFNALAYASTPLISGALGAGDDDRAGSYAGQALILAGVLGLGGMVLLELLAPLIVAAMGAGSEIAASSTSYLRIRGLAMPAVLVITVGHGVFRGVGDTRTPLVISLLFNLINLVLDPLLIFGLDMGLTGAAIASVVAQVIGAAIFLGMLAGGRAGIKLRRGEGTAAMRSLLGAGSALTIRTLSLVTTFTVATSVATRIGVDEVAGHQIASQIWVFLALVVDALAVAGQTLVALHLGRGRPDTARRLANRMLGWGLLWGLGLMVVFWVLRHDLPGWFTSDPEVITVTVALIPFVALTQPLNAVVFVFDGLLIGAARFGFLAIAMAGAAVLTIVVLLSVTSITGVWWALTMFMVARLVPMAWRYASAVS